MIKKSLPALSTLIIGLSVLGSSPTFATVLSPGKTAYTAEELITFTDSLYRELDEACGADSDCASSLYREKRLSGGIYDALDTFYYRPFLVTSVNPSTGTIKIYFQSRDVQNFWHRNTDGPTVVNYLYMGWDDPGTDPSLATVGTIRPISEAHLMPDHFHYIYPTSSNTDGYSWPPTGVEYTIELGADSIKTNTNGYFEYKFATQYTSSHGYADYSSCLNSQYYREGMECRGIIPAGSDYQFVPYFNGTPAYPPYISDIPTDNGFDPVPNDNPTNPNDGSTNSDESGNNSDDSSTHNPPSSNSATEESSSSVDSTTLNSTNITNDSRTYNNYPTRVLAENPISLARTISGRASKDADDVSTLRKTESNDTSIDSSRDDNSVIEIPSGGESKANCTAVGFPWWLIVLIIGADIVVMWLLYPKKEQNSARNFKK